MKNDEFNNLNDKELLRLTGGGGVEVDACSAKCQWDGLNYSTLSIDFLHNLLKQLQIFFNFVENSWWSQKPLSNKGFCKNSNLVKSK